jgi:general secretion pathway protein D
MSVRGALILATIALLATPSVTLARQEPVATFRNDSVTIRFVDADMRAAVQAIGRYLDKPVILPALQDGARVTLETPRAVHRSALPALLRGILESAGLELLEDSTAFRVRPAFSPMPNAPRSPTAPGQQELFVVRLSHARAQDVAATVNALYGRSAALGEPGAPAATLPEQLRQTRVPNDAPAQPGPAAGGRPAVLAGDVVIVPDGRSNTLLVRSSRADFEVLEAAIRELDVRPLQVLVEVLIVEVRRDRGYDLGTEFGLPLTPLRGSSRTEIATEQNGGGLGDFALRVMNFAGLDIDATLRAAARRGDVSIISRPILVTANNETASIMVGSQRPFVQVSRSLPTDAPTRDQVVQYKDVGTQLTVTPTVSDDGYVMLSVMQEVNAATTETAFDAPVISTRSVQTRLLIRDGHTVVLGGLADRQRDVNASGVPLLSSVPLLGILFGRRSRRTSETELFVFLTPRVIHTDDDAEALTAPYREQATGGRR